MIRNIQKNPWPYIWSLVVIIGVLFYVNQTYSTKTEINNRFVTENPCMPKSKTDPAPRDVEDCRSLAATIYRFFPNDIRQAIGRTNPTVVQRQIQQALRRAGERRQQRRGNRGAPSDSSPSPGVDRPPITRLPGPGATQTSPSPPPTTTQPGPSPPPPGSGSSSSVETPQRTPTVKTPPVGPVPSVEVPPIELPQPSLCTDLVRINCKSSRRFR